MGELAALIEDATTGPRPAVLWACAHCGRAAPAWHRVLVGGLVTCRDFTCRDWARGYVPTAKPVRRLRLPRESEAAREAAPKKPRKVRRREHRYLPDPPKHAPWSPPSEAARAFIKRKRGGG